MPAFDYRAPESIDEALALLAAGGERARPFAGGTGLLVQMRQGFVAPDLLVDLKRIPELVGISFDPERGLTVGATVPLWRLCDHPDVARHYPGLVDAVSAIGGPAIQSPATLGGNLCHALPSADSIPARIAVGATATLASPAGRRTVPVAGFCTGPRQTLLGPGELLISLRLPPPVPRSAARYLRFTPRGELDLAVAGVAAWLAPSDDLATITAARIALGAVAPTPTPASAPSTPPAPRLCPGSTPSSPPPTCRRARPAPPAWAS